MVNSAVSAETRRRRFQSSQLNKAHESRPPASRRTERETQARVVDGVMQQGLRSEAGVTGHFSTLYCLARQQQQGGGDKQLQARLVACPNAIPATALLRCKLPVSQRRGKQLLKGVRDGEDGMRSLRAG